MVPSETTRALCLRRDQSSDRAGVYVLARTPAGVRAVAAVGIADLAHERRRGLLHVLSRPAAAQRELFVGVVRGSRHRPVPARPGDGTTLQAPAAAEYLPAAHHILLAIPLRTQQSPLLTALGLAPREQKIRAKEIDRELGRAEGMGWTGHGDTNAPEPGHWVRASLPPATAERPGRGRRRGGHHAAVRWNPAKRYEL